jgi:hypothetical protein
MTICIAAACGSTSIVLGFDSMISADIWKSETETKLVDLLGGKLYALWSGDVAEAQELIAIYRSHLSQLGEINGMTLQEQLRIPLRLFKRRKAEHILGMRLGMTWVEFLAAGEKLEKMTSALVKSIWQEINDSTINADLVVFGFLPDDLTLGTSFRLYDPYIFRVRLGDVEIMNHFACVGVGTDAAELSLHRRKQERSKSLLETIYHVYEAKKSAELAPEVGAKTTIAVVMPPSADSGFSANVFCLPHSIGQDGINWLESLYQQYSSPKPIPALTPPESTKALLGE